MSLCLLIKIIHRSNFGNDFFSKLNFVLLYICMSVGMVVIFISGSVGGGVADLIHYMLPVPPFILLIYCLLICMVRVSESLVFCVVFCRPLFVLFPLFFSFLHCIVSPSLIYGF